MAIRPVVGASVGHHHAGSACRGEEPGGPGDNRRVTFGIPGDVADEEIEQQETGVQRGLPRTTSAQSFFHLASSSRITAGSTNLSGSFCARSGTRRLAGT